MKPLMIVFKCLEMVEMEGNVSLPYVHVTAVVSSTAYCVC